MENELSQVANAAPPVEKVYEEALEKEVAKMDANVADLTAQLPKAEVPPKPAGMLFESIGYQSPQDIPQFIDKMGINDAAMILLTVVGYAHKKGLFNLLESEVASKAVRVFTTPRPPMAPPEEKIQQPPAQPVV